MSNPWTGVIATAQTDGPALTAAAAASLLPGHAKLPVRAGELAIGSMIHIKASGRISSVITTPGTARFDVRLNGTVVFDGLAILLDTVAAHNNVGWDLDLLLTCRAIGPSATNFIGKGSWACEDILGTPATAPKGSLTAVLPWNSAPAVGSNIDSTVDNILDLFFTQTVATGSITLHQYVARLINPN